MRANRLAEIIDVVQNNNIDTEFHYEWAAGFKRNQMLVDLENTPDYLRDEILDQWSVDPGNRDGLFNYFVKSRLNNLIENISEF